ncbi:MAG: Fe-S cluster assembly protein SufD [Opitutales bacterium]
MISNTLVNSNLSQLDGPAFIEEKFSNEPVWVQKARLEAWEHFSKLPLPTRKDEQWRFATVNRTILDDVELSVPNEGLLSPSVSLPAAKDALMHFHFVDDVLVSAPEVPAELAEQGVIISSLSAALAENESAIRPWLFQNTTELGSEKFEYLHRALVSNGLFVFVPKNVEVSGFIAATYEATGSRVATFPHTLVVAEDNARVQVLDSYLTAEGAEGAYVSASAHVHVSNGARVERTAIQNINTSSNIFQLDSGFVSRDAEFQSAAINLGSKKARYENQVSVEGTGANAKMYALTVADGTQEFDQRTFQTHVAANTFSDLLYKNALMDSARTVFSGLIRVGDDAQQTDAYQTNRNILLDNTAEANSLPGLEISANDVKCSHGATTGKLSEEELFYFLQRGIPPRIAKHLMVTGFLEEVTEKISAESIQDTVRELIEKKFSTHTAA